MKCRIDQILERGGCGLGSNGGFLLFRCTKRIVNMNAEQSKCHEHFL
jgi:hypothetical protein